MADGRGRYSGWAFFSDIGYDRHGMFPSVQSRMTAVTLGVLLPPLVIISSAAAHPQAQGPTDPRVNEVRALVRVVYAALRGGRVAAQRPFGWSSEFFKGTDGTTHIPFTLTVDRSRLRTTTAVLYVLVTPRDGPSDRVPNGRPNTLEPEELQGPPAPPIAFEAVYFIDLAALSNSTTDQGGDVYSVRRAFSLPAGDYDVYAALGPGSQTRVEIESSALREADNVMIIKQELLVPDS